MWKLSINKTIEKAYLDKMLPGLVRRVREWQQCGKYKSIILPDWKESEPKETGTLIRLLIAEPNEAYFVNQQLMGKFIHGYKGLPDLHDRLFVEKNKKKFKELETLLDYQGQISGSESKSYWLAEQIGHNTCTYCNRQYTFTINGKNNNERITRPEFDHWFPKSLFPLLSLNIYNLIPCCSICNSGAKGDAIFQLDTHIHPYLQKDDDPMFKFMPAMSDLNGKSWRVIIERDAEKYPKVDNTIKALHLDEIYDLHGPLEVKDLMDFAQAYNGIYLHTVYKLLTNDLGLVGYSQEEVYRMLFGAESVPSKFLDRPLSKLKYDVLKYLHIINEV